MKVLVRQSLIHARLNNPLTIGDIVDLNDDIASGLVADGLADAVDDKDKISAADEAKKEKKPARKGKVKANGNNNS